MRAGTVDERVRRARIVHEVSLSTDNPPPPFPASPVAKPNAVPSPAKSRKPDPTVKMINDLLKVADSVSRFRTWLNTPVPPKPPTRRRSSPEKDGTAIRYPGDSERSAQRNDAHRSEVNGTMVCRPIELLRSPSDELKGINQEGKPYPPDMYDTTTIKNDICRNDPQHLHQFFQFQHVEVDGTFAEKIKLKLMADAARTGVPDDLTAALGSFVIYAAIGHVRLSRDPFGTQRTTAEVTGAWVYVKDNFTFTDEPGNDPSIWGTGAVTVLS